MKKLLAFLVAGIVVAGTLAMAGCKGETEANPTALPEPTPVSYEDVEGSIRVMSFNLDANDSTISKRAPGMISVFLGNMPDSFGVQECRGAWNQLLNDGLKDKYARVGVGADGIEGSYAMFGTYIYYLKDKYNVVEDGQFWLSKTPDVPSIFGPTVDCNRTCTWVILEDKVTGFRYVHMNSHLDWMDVSVTNYQIAMIREQIKRFMALGLPVFATGDYNNDEGSATYHIMVDDPLVNDSKFVAAKSMSLGTYPDYGKYDVNIEMPIDFCFISNENIIVDEYRVIDDRPKNIEISDHNGLLIDAKATYRPSVFLKSPAPDISSMTLEIGRVTSKSAEIKFDQTAFSKNAVSYIFTLKTSEGKIISEERIGSGYMNAKVPETITFSAKQLAESTAYIAEVKAVSLGGMISDAKTISFTTKETASPVAPMAADIFDLVIDGDNAFDKSSGENKLTNIGKVPVSLVKDTAALSFDGKSCLKTDDFSEFYDKMKDGFSIEADVSLTSVNGDMCILSNLHAGGFGFEVIDGELSFLVHINGSYQKVSMKMAKGIWYHIVGVYDGKSICLYANGNLADEKQVSGEMGFATVKSAQYLAIGADSDASGNCEYFAKGLIKIARVYSKPLSEANVLYLSHEARK